LIPSGGRKMSPDAERVRANIRAATTEDLLNRATAYREGMEPAALDMIESELRARGVTWDSIAEHEQKQREEGLFDTKGIALRCCKCRRPAVVQGWDWHYLWGLVPLFPSRLAWCEEHRPKGRSTSL
jgi:hypothetical protein